MKPFNILLTCSANKTQILEWVKNSINKFDTKINVYCGDTNNQVLTRHLSDNFWKMPETKISNFKKIQNFCIKHNIRIIFPTSDEELVFWSKFKEKLKKKKIFVMVSDEDTVKKCLDKLAFYKLHKNNTSSIFTSKNIKDFKTKKRFVSKKRFGYGSRDIILNSGYNNILSITKKNRQSYIFQDYIKSDSEISVDCFFSSKNNRLLKAIPRTRNLIVSGESAVTTVINSSKFYNYIKDISKNIRFSGHVMFQFLLKKKKIYLLECNPRIGGASFISYFNSMDSLYYFILESFFPEKKIELKENTINKGKLLMYKTVKFLK